MNTSTKKLRCPLCRSPLTQTRYYEIIGLWEERARLEKSLKDKLKDLREERKKFIEEKKSIKAQMKKEKKKAVKEAEEKGKKKEKARADRLAKSLQGLIERDQEQRKQIRELRDQLKKGTTPQVEGLNLEEELARSLRKEFAQDKIERHGKTGDVLQRVNFRNKQIGIILYECKKTAKFNKSFIEQTRRAMVARRATYGVLVTTASKKETAGFWVEKEIIIVHPYGALYIAKVLRNWIIEIHSLKISEKEVQNRANELMKFIKSDDFKSIVRDSIHRTRSLNEMLVKEMKTHKRVWGERFSHYDKIHDNVSGIELISSGILKGLPTEEALAQRKLKQLPSPEFQT